MNKKRALVVSCLFCSAMLATSCQSSSEKSSLLSSGVSSSQTQSTSTELKYVAKFFNDTVELFSCEVLDGAYAVYTGATPTRASTAQYSYSFKGWDKDPAATIIHENTSFYAQFDSTLQKYTVKFMDGTTELQSGEVEYNSFAVYNGTMANKTVDGVTYDYLGWDKDPATTPIVENTVFTAQYKAVKVVKDFENLADGDSFGDWSAVKSEGNTYIKATGSGWVSPKQTANLYNDELSLSNDWIMSARLFLVGNVAGNLSFASDSFSEANEGTFDKFIFWHTDENNGYVQSRRNCTDSSDGDVLMDCGWLTQHAGFADDTIGTVAHNAWISFKAIRHNGTFSIYVNDILVGSQDITGLLDLKDIKFKIYMSSPDAEVRLDDFSIMNNAVSNDFNSLTEGTKSGGWTAIKEGDNTYLKAEGSTWVAPMETGKLYNGEIDLGANWEMNAKVFLVGNVAGNISFVSNTFTANAENTFNKFLFWHTDENNGYVQSRQNCTDFSDGDVIMDSGWLTQHDGFNGDTIGTVAHNAWVDVKMARNGDTVSVSFNGISLAANVSVAGMTDLKDVAFRIAMSSETASAYLDDFSIRRTF